MPKPLIEKPEADMKLENGGKTAATSRPARPYGLVAAWAAFMLVVMLALLLSAVPASGAIVNTSFPVAGTSGDELAPAVAGDIAVWEDRGGTYSDIRGKNLRTDAGF
jgi:hypothetical protein